MTVCTYIPIATQVVRTATVALRIKQRQNQDEYRRAVASELHLKQVEDTDNRLSAALTPLFTRQTRDASRRLRGIVTERGTKNVADQAAALVEQIFTPVEWLGPLVDISMPILANASAEAAAAEMIMVGAPEGVYSDGVARGNR